MGGCTGTALKGLIDEYVGRDSSGSRQQDELGYDSLDVFINGLLLIQAVPVETKVREPEMVYYQQTPASSLSERTRLGVINTDRTKILAKICPQTSASEPNCGLKKTLFGCDTSSFGRKAH
jgi:hypothetical protein